MSKQYSCRPSQILGLEDSYTAFCFDEACCEIIAHLQNDEKPNYKINKEQEKEYKSFKDFYKDYGG